MSALNEESVVSSNKAGNTIQLPEPELINLVKDLQKKVGDIERSMEIKNLRINTLQNEVTDLKKRILMQERYTSKDCLILSNFPINPESTKLAEEVCNAFVHYFSYKISPDCIKACHPLPSRGRSKPIIVKFVYFNNKNEIYDRRHQLAGQYNGYGQRLFINERLPQYDNDIKRFCDENNIITTTKNCQVKVFIEGASGNYVTQNVNSIRAVEDIASKVAKKRQARPNNLRTNVQFGHQQRQHAEAPSDWNNKVYQRQYIPFWKRGPKKGFINNRLANFNNNILPSRNFSEVNAIQTPKANTDKRGIDEVGDASSGGSRDAFCTAKKLDLGPTPEKSDEQQIEPDELD